MKIGIDKVWLFSTSFKVHNSEYLNQNVPRLIHSTPASTPIIEDDDGKREFKHKEISGTQPIYKEEQGKDFLLDNFALADETTAEHHGLFRLLEVFTLPV